MKDKVFASKSEQRRVEAQLADKVIHETHMCTADCHPGMTETERQRLKRLVTDLEPFIGALEGLSDGSWSNLDTHAWQAAKALRDFSSVVRSEVTKRK